MKLNRLSGQTSPYLLQHAFNPVDWRVWSREAFEEARALDKAVFVSVGYSSCHWCHVMEKESFSDEETAGVMNLNFICIKVDREQRPDIDSALQRAAGALGCYGGWPLSIFMTSSKMPFYAGTYFPPESRAGLPGFRDLCSKIAAFYAEQPDKALEAAERAAEYLKNLDSARKNLEPDPALCEASAASQSIRFLKTLYDKKYGGFGSEPKFPCVNILELFLLKPGENKELLGIVSHTLSSMAEGAIYDQLSGGFHRYSTDRRWRLPHFEKMLYDNALLAQVYTLCCRVKPDGLLKDAARKTLSFMADEMTSPEGGFYSAFDADTEGEEGKFYLWEMDEFLKELGPEQARIAGQYFGVGELGDYVLRRAAGIEQISRETKKPVDEIIFIIGNAVEKLKSARNKRPRPFRDEKIITAWNGMAVSAFAVAGAVFEEPAYLKIAERTVEFIEKNLALPGGKLMRSFKDSPDRTPGFIDDYAYFADGLIQLYLATLEKRFLEKALSVIKKAFELFYKDGSFYFTEKTQYEGPVFLLSDPADASFPSGEGKLIYNIIRLGGKLDEKISQAAAEILKKNLGAVLENPMSYACLVKALIYKTELDFTVNLSGPCGDEELKKMENLLKKTSAPGIMVYVNYEPDAPVRALICRKFACFSEARSSKQLEEMLKGCAGRGG